MARETKCRKVEALPRFRIFKPVGVQRSKLPESIIKIEELEAIRLKDLLGMEQSECAETMGVSRPTFQRILAEGRRKLAEALIEGKVIRIEGGDYCLGQENCRKAQLMIKKAHCMYAEVAETGEPRAKGISQRNIIAICADGNTPEALVDGRFGRCKYFLLWNESQHKLKPLTNQGLTMGEGAGAGAVQELLRRRVGRLICNRIGPNALSVFSQAGGCVYLAPEGMPIDIVLDKLHAGELMQITAPNQPNPE